MPTIPFYEQGRMSSDNIQQLLGLRGKMALEPVVRAVEEVLESVRREGDAGLLRYTERFDGVKLAAKELEVTEEELAEARAALPPEVHAVLEEAAGSIRRYHEAQLKAGQQSFETTTAYGGMVGMMVRPLRRVGIYVPGGTAPLPSSVLMNVLPAKVAGVEEIIMCTPPQKDGRIAPVILVAASIAGADRIFKVGGAQAIAALASGTETIPAVDKICGPGNIYVNTAKRMVYGSCDIDMFAGPSEILVIADETAHPRFVAADLLSQAEHDVLASAILLTTSLELARAVQTEVDILFEKACRQQIMERSLSDYAAIIVVSDLEEAADFADQIAPEHLELCVAEEKMDGLLSRIHNAGAVFMGHYSPESLGDYLAGPNHVLPTSGTARFFSPLNVGDFQKKMSLIRFDEAALRRAGKTIVCFAGLEGLDCHARAVSVRVGNDR